MNELEQRMRDVVEAARRIHDVAEQQTEAILAMNVMHRTREVNADLNRYHAICSMLHEPLRRYDEARDRS